MRQSARTPQPPDKDSPLDGAASNPSRPPQLIPNDHLRLLVELLQPVGPELARRWLAALLLVHRSEREAVVNAVERQLVRLYPLDEHDRRPSDPPAGQPEIQIKPGRRPGRMSA